MRWTQIKQVFKNYGVNLPIFAIGNMQCLRQDISK